jgi:hypothetical protein
MFLLSKTEPSLSFLVATSMDTPLLGSLEVTFTLNECVPANAVIVVAPGSGSKEKAMFSSTSTGGVGGFGVGVLGLPQEATSEDATKRNKMDFRIINLFYKITLFTFIS